MCGQTVAAMLGHTTPARVAALLGHSGPTTWQELYSVLCVLGVPCNVRLVPVFGPEDVSRAAILRRPTGISAIRHWVAVCDGLVYDPGRLTEYPLEDMSFSILPAEAVTYCAAVRRGI